MLFNRPLSAQKADRIVESLPSLADEQVIDVGCGEGELLIRVIERKEGKGFGVDQNAECIFNARQAASRRLPENRCEFKEADVQELPFERDSFGLAICLGSTHAFGSGEIAYPNSLRELGRVVRPGGLLLIGEGYQPPFSPMNSTQFRSSRPFRQKQIPSSQSFPKPRAGQAPNTCNFGVQT